MIRLYVSRRDTLWAAGIALSRLVWCVRSLIRQALFLKNHFGTGYTLTTTKTATFNVEALLAIAKKHVATAKLERETAGEADIRLPGVAMLSSDARTPDALARMLARVDARRSH